MVSSTRVSPRYPFGSNLISLRNRLTTVARNVVITKNSIDAGKPKLSPIIPNMIGDTAPGIEPIENKRPKARPLDLRGLTSV